MPLTRLKIAFVKRTKLSGESVQTLAAVFIAKASIFSVTAIASLIAAIESAPIAGAHAGMVQAQAVRGAIFEAVRDGESGAKSFEVVVCVAVEEDEHEARKGGHVLGLGLTAEGAKEGR